MSARLVSTSSFNNQLPSPRSPGGGYPPQRDPIDEFFDVTQVDKYAERLDVGDCLHYMLNFVKSEQLDSIVGDRLGDEHLGDEYLRQHLRSQAEMAAKLPIKFGYINPDLVSYLVVIILYDLVILIGGCIFCGHFHISTLENKS